MSENAESRQRLVAGAADMMRRRGLNATSVRELAKHAQAPLGSTYHYFPGGKYQLAAEAVQWADDLTARALTSRMLAACSVLPWITADCSTCVPETLPVSAFVPSAARAKSFRSLVSRL